ncbi:MAG: hypothetical protein AABX90_02365, partial [Nanoarchaeota archaeon]
MFRNNVWYKRFGWKRNPFSIKINDSVFVGLTEERRILANLVEGGNICMIIGDNGVGKSSLLKWLEKRVRKHYFVYLSAEWVKNNFDLNGFIDKQKSFFGNYPKNIVLLVDESQKLENWFRIEIQALWEKNIVKGIVFSHDGEGQYENLPNQLKSRISNRIIRINRLKKEDAYELIRLRCGGKNPFDEYAMDEVIKRSNGNPRKILENCERVCIS